MAQEVETLSLFIDDDSEDLAVEELNTKLDNILDKLQSLMSLMEACETKSEDNKN